MYKLTVYKKNKGCPNCAILDRLAPTIQKKYPEINWEFVVLTEDDTPPEFLKSFPTSVLTKDGDEIITVAGYDTLAKQIHKALN